MSPGKLASMARRNLWRNRRRTLITLSSIAIGVMLAVIFTGLGDSNFSRMIELAARLGGGHVTVQHPEYQDKPTFGRTLTGASRLREALLLDAEVAAVVTRIGGQLMLASAGRSYGAGFIAFDPEQEDESTLSLLEAIDEGELFAADAERAIVLGRELAANLGAGVGRKVVLSLTDKHGEIVQESARVVGLVHSGAPSIDAALCLLPLAWVGQVLRYDADEALTLGVFLRDQRGAPAAAARLGASVGPGAVALSWQALQPELASFIAMKVASARFLELVIMALVAAGIFNTLFVSVMERLREFGILLTLGFSPAGLFALVMCESLWLALAGLVAAAGLTAAPYGLLATRGFDISAMLGEAGAEVAGIAMSPVMYAEIYPENLAAIALAALLATLAAGLYPAWRAGHVEPVETIRLV